jgi:hypothetical protein
MDPTYATRKAMLRRLRDLVVAGGAAVVAIAAGCGGKVVIDGATAGAAGTGGARGTGNTGGSGVGGLGGAGGAGGAMCTLTTTGTSGNQIETTECFLVPPTGCPSIYHASMYIIPQQCAYLVSVDCGPVQEGAECCYLTREQPQPCGMPAPPPP